MSHPAPILPRALLGDVRQMILPARQEVARTVCDGKRAEHVELLEPSQSGIHVASYFTDLLPKTQLKRKLHETVRLARAHLRAATVRDASGPIIPARSSGF
jgi:hypothetical protein